jgi:hypothetical protein
MCGLDREQERTERQFSVYREIARNEQRIIYDN